VLLSLVWLVAGCRTYPEPSPEKKEVLFRESPLVPEAKAQGVYHTVKRGETLWRIARTYGIDLQTLAETNNIIDPTQIKVDQKIFIPGATSLKKVIIEDKDSFYSPPTIIKRKGEFIWPVEGEVVIRFGVQEGLRHEGIEIAAPLGTPVKAAQSGVVVFEGNLKGYGNLLIIKHENDFKTVYAYNQVNLVSAGSKVKQGEIIAKVGNTGRASSPRLHFQIRDKDQARNPIFFLP